MSTTASMPADMLQSIEILRSQRAEKVKARTSSRIAEDFRRSQDSIPKSNSSTPRGHRPGTVKVVSRFTCARGQSVVSEF